MPSSLSLVMIVRDEARCIRRCLESVRDLVDEMVVLDTGSVDDTVALATAAGARVHTATWPDDFAAARNAALDLADGDWRIVLDADEWLADGGEELARLRRSTPDFVATVEVESDTPSGTALSLLPRVLPRHVRYAGRIHEQPVHDLPTRPLAVRLGHDGYAAEAMLRKGDRNRRLLEAELATTPHDAYLTYQLGKDHQVHGRMDEACAAYRRANALVGRRTDPAWRHDLVIRWLYCLGQVGATAEAIGIAELELALWSGSADFHFTLGDLLLNHALAHPAEAAAMLPLIEASWLHCLELGDTPRYAGSVRGRGSTLAAHNLAVFYETLGRTEDAARYRSV